MIIVYDITDEKSFQRCQEWFQSVKSSVKFHIPIFLVGNKSDLESKRKVTPQDVQEFVSQQTSRGMKSWETSAKSGENVSDLFHQLAEDIAGTM